MKLLIALIPAGYSGDYSDLNVFEIQETALQSENRPVVHFIKVEDEVSLRDARPVEMGSDGKLVDSSGRKWMTSSEFTKSQSLDSN